ncbi:MAG: hypothetical protein EP329_19790 [Deltaproteobacteria bacterium]|nr:MAG: hypothetical protein EP329_19790 [Deltaproteobacteria bacterium]
MKLGRVEGTVVTTVQHPFYEGRKQLLVRYLKPDGTAEGDNYVLAVDIVGAGVGEMVLVQDEGNSSRQILDAAPYGPVRSLIVGIVDDASIG